MVWSPDTSLALAALSRRFGADRSALFVHHGEEQAFTTLAANVNGADHPSAIWHEASLEVVRRARKGAVFFDPHDDASASALTLGILCAMAAPIHSGNGDFLGVLYMDFRRPDAFAEESQLSDLVAAAQEFGMATTTSPAFGSLDLDRLVDLPGLAHLAGEIRATMHSDLPILIEGETGTGKTLLAHAIAGAKRAPTVRVTLGLSHDLNTITSELFGHEKGAFSGAGAKRSGLVAQANGGVLILDELLNLPLGAQQLLLDFVQFGTYRPLGYGGVGALESSARVIAATNGSVSSAVERGDLREDLLHRLAGFRLVLPPLRARRGDISALVPRILHELDPGRDWQTSVDFRRSLLSPERTWPGNVRELVSVVTRARARALSLSPNAKRLEQQHLDPETPQHAPVRRSSPSLGEEWTEVAAQREALDTTEGRLIRDALRRCGGVVSKAARLLGTPRTSMLSRMRTLGIDRAELEPEP